MDALNKMPPENLAVIGAGSWATALVKLAAGNGHNVHWYVRRSEARQHLLQTSRHPDYLTGVALPLENIRLAESPQEAVAAAETVLLVVPTAHLSRHLDGLQTHDFAGKTVCTAIKGLMPGNGQLVCEYVTRTYAVPDGRYVAILGPGHAEEVAEGGITYLTCCGLEAATAARIAWLLRSPFVRATTSADVQGAELASALKNVYAMAAGLALGLGYGDNFLSVLVANALTEMDHLLQSVFPATRQVTASVYAGDLFVTAYSAHSRNRRMGQRLGQGEPLEHILAHSHMVAEGYYVACLLRTRGMEPAPIVGAVQAVVVDGCPPATVFKELEPMLC